MAAATVSSLVRFVFVILLTVVIGECRTLELEFTVVLGAGRRECFFQPMNTGNSLEIDYQVIQGAQLDINFSILSPKNRFLVNEMRRRDGDKQITADLDGDYKICFDNTFSKLTEKVVYFEIYVDIPGDEDSADEWSQFARSEEVLDMELEDMQQSLSLIKSRLSRVRHVQGLFKNIESRDRAVMEENYSRINFWSTIHCALMIFVGVMQVYLVRHLFATKKYTRT